MRELWTSEAFVMNGDGCLATRDVGVSSPDLPFLGAAAERCCGAKHAKCRSGSSLVQKGWIGVPLLSEHAKIDKRLSVHLCSTYETRTNRPRLMSWWQMRPAQVGADPLTYSMISCDTFPPVPSVRHRLFNSKEGRSHY